MVAQAGGTGFENILRFYYDADENVDKDENVYDDENEDKDENVDEE